MSSFFSAVCFPSLFPSNQSLFLPVLPSSCLSLRACDLGWQFLSSERNASLFLRSALILPTNHWGAPPTEPLLIGRPGRQIAASPGSRVGRDRTRARAVAVSVSVREAENSPAGPEALAGDSAAESSQSPAAGNGKGIERFPCLYKQMRNHNSNSSSGILSQERGFQ